MLFAFALTPSSKPTLYISGEAEQECLHAAVPLWGLLLLPQAEGAGVPQHNLDQRVCRAKPQSQDRQLHPNLLNSFQFIPSTFHDQTKLLVKQIDTYISKSFTLLTPVWDPS